MYLIANCITFRYYQLLVIFWERFAFLGQWSSNAQMHHASMIGTQNCTKCTKIIFPRNYYPVKKYICSVRRKEYLEYMEIIHKRFHLFQCAYFFIDVHSPANWLTQNKEKYVQNGGMWNAYSLTHSIIMHWFHKKR